MEAGTCILSGAVACVSRNYPDGKWRIVCDERDGDHTYADRDAAARAEQVLAIESYTPKAIGQTLAELATRGR